MSDRERAAQPQPSQQATQPLPTVATRGEAVAPPPVPRRQRHVTTAARPAGEAQTDELPRHAHDEPVSVQADGRAAKRGLTVEHLLYLTILAAALFTRFWDLGSKALHHDESLHTYYSWVFATGGGYQHHPLMHGPGLFHVTGLIYLLFGDSDASSRYAPAFFGVVMVMLPYLLRGPRFLGRWGALATSLLILISPVLLYQSRYLRHDIFTLTCSLLLFICIVRYLERPQRRWIVIGAGTLSFLLTNHEIIFALVAIFFGFLYGALILRRLFTWWDEERRDLVYRTIGLHAIIGVLGLALLAFIPSRFVDRFYDIPWQNPTFNDQIVYYEHLFINPLFLAGLALVVGYAVGMVLIFRASRDESLLPEGNLEATFGPAEPYTPEHGLIHAWKDRSGLWIAAFVFLGIFVTLFTSMFTNLYGLVSSTIATDGTLLYWLGQHDFRRGEQPWFYYLLLFPQYEFFAFTLGSALAGITIIQAVVAFVRRGTVGPTFFFRLFVTAWYLGILVGLSYAGEKMPWLVAHISLPATILAGGMIGAIVDRVVARRAAASDADGTRTVAFGWPEWALAGVLLFAAASWFGIAARLTAADFVDAAIAGGYSRTATEYARDRWWWLAIPPIIAAIALLLFTLARGGRRVALATLSATVIVVSLLQVHTAWRLSFADPDVPTEMMIYTQTSPDVTRVMSEISALSNELTGSNGIEVWYDSGVSWPLQWYLRDFPNKRFYGASLSGPPGDAPVVLVSTERDNAVAPYLTGYTATEYVLRWWFPEELYRGFAIAPELPAGRSAWRSQEEPNGVVDIASSIAESVASAGSIDGQIHLYRLLMYRDLEQPLGQYRFKIYVRNDLLPLLNEIRY